MTALAALLGRTSGTGLGRGRDTPLASPRQEQRQPSGADETASIEAPRASWWRAPGLRRGAIVAWEGEMRIIYWRGLQLKRWIGGWRLETARQALSVAPLILQPRRLEQKGSGAPLRLLSGGATHCRRLH